MIDQLKKAHPVTEVCRALGMPRSSYYAGRRATGRRPTGASLLAAVRKIHNDNRRSYGTRRMAGELREQGHAVGRCRARTLMHEAGIWHDRRRPHRYRRALAPSHVAPNQLDRQFAPAAPNLTWAGDITYLPTRQGWLYLAIVVDLYARRIVGWAFSATPDTTLALAALDHAMDARKPAPGLLFHSDQGCQYTSTAFVQRLQRLAITQSMSRRGNCWDNAVVERVFRTLKHEWMQVNAYRTHAEALADLLPFLSSWYNHRRLHSTIGMRPPAIVDAMAA
jgi:transposase InsO family protein